MGKLLVSTKNRISHAKRGLSVFPEQIPDKVFIESKPEKEWSITEPYAKEWMARILDGYYGQSNFLELFHCLPEVFAPIHEIASRVADARWELRKQSNDEVDYKDADFNRLFSAPNPFNNIQQLVYMSVCYYLLTGRQFWSLNRPSILDRNNYENISSWFALPSHQVWVEQKKVDPYTCTRIDDFVKEYRVRDGISGTNGKKFEPHEVMPMVNFSLRQNYDFNKNNSPLLGAEKAIKNLIPVYEARGTIYIKRGALGFIVSRKTDDSGSVALTSTETDALLRDYNSTYGVTNGRSNIGITGQPIDYVAVGQTIKEMMPFDETAADAIAIASTLRVPRHLVPTKDMGTFSNVDISMKAFYDDVIIPMAEMFAGLWTTGMGFANYRKYVYPNYDHIDILQENKKLKAEVDRILTETAALQYEKGMITKNERQGMIGAQIIEDGDKYSFDEDNKSPMIERIGISGTESLMVILASTTMAEEAKVDALVLLFGFAKKDAKKLVVAKEVEEIDPVTGKPIDKTKINKPNDINSEETYD